MNNYEKIKGMIFSEFLEFLNEATENSCKICSAARGYECLNGGDCQKYLIEQWLLSEVDE